MTANGAVAQGRRERNKQDKLARITAAACKLIAEQGIGAVTTLQVAEAADVATGTLFLYAKTKGELLLLAQNSEYERALELGKVAASRNDRNVVDAVVALWRPIIDCNRVHVENGRAYLKEVVFGETSGPNRLQALALMGETEAETANLICKISGISIDEARERAKGVSAFMLLLLSSPLNAAQGTHEIAAQLAEQLKLTLP
jgi:AcrR family transcriptional regulator